MLIFILIWFGFFLALLISFRFFFFWVTYQILVQLIKLIVLEDLDAARHDIIKPSATLGNESVSVQKNKINCIINMMSLMIVMNLNNLQSKF